MWLQWPGLGRIYSDFGGSINKSPSGTDEVAETDELIGEQPVSGESVDTHVSILQGGACGRSVSISREQKVNEIGPEAKLNKHVRYESRAEQITIR